MSIAFVKDMYGKEMVLKNCKKCGDLQLFQTGEITLYWILKKGGYDFFIDRRKKDRIDVMNKDYVVLVINCTRCGEEGGYII